MTERDSTPTTSRRRHILRLAAFAAVLFVMFYLVAVVRVVDVDRIRQAVDAAGPAAPVAYVAVSSVLGAIFVPGPLLAGGSGLLFGPVLGLFVTLGATVGTALITCLVGRRAGRSSARGLLGDDRADRIDAMIERRGLWAVVGQRFIPGMSDALACYVFGAFGVPLWQIAVGAFIGSIPRAFVYTALGASIGDLSGPLLYAAIAVWCMTAIAGVVVVRSGFRTWRGHRRTVGGQERSDPGNDSAQAPPRVPDDVLDDLRRRLRDTRWVSLPPTPPWQRGVDFAYLRELADYWAEHYDWRAHEHRIRELPWQKVELNGQMYRVVHQRAGADAPTVVLLHGWPDSVLRFERVLPLLSDCNVVVPALPGFPFAPPSTTAMSTSDMGAVVTRVMAALGYRRYVVSGGDVGAWVGHAAATAAPDAVSALHLTEIPYEYLLAADPAGLDAAERVAADDARQWRAAEGSYDELQSTKPHTLAAGLADSPAGLLAWIVEKLWSWSEGDMDAVFSRDELLTWVTAYWVTGTIGTSFHAYSETPAPPERVSPPTAVSLFPGEFLTAPESFGRRFFDIRSWDLAPRGGHFAAWEQPELYVAALRDALRL